MNALISFDVYTFAVLLIAVLVLGTLVGIVWSPWWERRIERRLQLRRLRERAR